MNDDTKRIELLEAVLEITKLQPELLASEDMDKLTESVENRQRLIDELVALGGVPGERAKLLYGEIAALDKANTQNAQTRLSELQSKLRKLRESHAAAVGYENRRLDEGSTYFDKKQ